jgi:hypothetical protein
MPHSMKFAGRIDHEEPHRLADDLAAEQQRHVVFDAGLAQRLAIGLAHDADGAADELRGAEHRRDILQRLGLAGLRIGHALVQQADDRLGEGEVCRRVASAIVRSPGQEKTCSLRKVEMSSSPALVRVSAIITSPSWTRMPAQ